MARTRKKRAVVRRGRRPVSRAVAAALEKQREAEEDALPIVQRPPSSPEVAATLNRLALAMAAAFEELSKLRHEIGARERLDVQRRKTE